MEGRRVACMAVELEDGSVLVRAVTPLDLSYLRGLEAGLQEWSSADDDVAFANL